MDMLVDYLPSGESSYYHYNHAGERNSALFSERQMLHKMMIGEFNWKLDQTVADIIERVNMSSRVTDRDLKVTCDTWSPEENFNARSKHPKPAVLRCMRRLIYTLLKKEITQFTTSVQPVYCSKDILRYGKGWPEEFTVHSSHSEYWPLFLVEKAYYCCEPLSRLILNLVLQEDEGKIAGCTSELLVLKIDPAAISEVIGWLKNSSTKQ
jgi:hypothetical protein